MMPVLSIGLALWFLPLLLVALARGAESLHARLYAFFMKAALVTFGGAYAVLAYVTQEAAAALAGSAGSKRSTASRSRRRRRGRSSWCCSSSVSWRAGTIPKA